MITIFLQFADGQSWNKFSSRFLHQGAPAQQRMPQHQPEPELPAAGETGMATAADRFSPGNVRI